MAERRMLKQKIATGNTGARLPREEEAVRTVTVACKIPMGMILQLQEFIEVYQPGPGGSRVVKEAVRTGPRYTVRGNRLPFGVIPDFQMTSTNNGYALTPGIPKDFWDQWVEQNKMADYVVNKIIFAYEQLADVKACAEEHEKRKSGLEPIDPMKSPDRRVATDEVMAKRMSIEYKEPARTIDQGMPTE